MPAYPRKRRLEEWQYIDEGATCPDCGTDNPMRYKDGDHCVRCVVTTQFPLMKAMAPAGHQVLPRPCPFGPHVEILDGEGCTCTTCKAINPRKQARVDRQKWYQPVTPCERCGTTALRYVANGRCQGCNPGYGTRPRK